MTDDILGWDTDGETVIIVEQRNGDKTEGTGLVRDLINSPKKVEITNDTKGVNIKGKEPTLEDNAYTLAMNPSNASNGKGTSSKILFSPDTRAEFEAQDGSKQISSVNMVLAHELIHADNNRTGTREVGKKPQNPSFSSNREEEKTTFRENIIRHQMKQKLRSVGSHNKH